MKKYIWRNEIISLNSIDKTTYSIPLYTFEILTGKEKGIKLSLMETEFKNLKECE